MYDSMIKNIPFIHYNYSNIV